MRARAEYIRIINLVGMIFHRSKQKCKPKTGTRPPCYRSSSSNPQSQQIQRVVPNMLQAPFDRSVIHDVFRAQSSTLESQSNNNNLHSNEPDGTTVHNDNNDAYDFPMQFDTTEDRPPQPDFSLLILMIWERKKIHPGAESQAWTFNRS